MDYSEFLEQKTDYGTEDGFEPLWMPDFLFDFQRHLTDWAIRKGRAAIFTDCGTGKTVIQLVWAQNIVQKTNKPVLILTPLAVSGQTLEEAEKFSIEAHRATPDKNPTTIQVINYEQLHKYDATQYAGVVCDECFVGDTLVDTKKGTVPIKNVRPGSFVYGATGLRKVKSITKRYCETLVLTSIQGRDIISSENHLFFTKKGWVKAKDLQEGNYVIFTTEAMRMVREGFDGKTDQNGESFLWNLLLSEMENEPTRDISEGSFPRSCSETRQEEKRMVQSRQSKSIERIRENQAVESNLGSGSQGENLKAPKRNRSQTTYSGRQWSPNAETSKNVTGSTGQRMDRRIRPKPETAPTRISVTLQDRHCQQRIDDCHRGGRLQSCGLGATSTGCKEREKIAGARVDRIAVYKSDDPIFTRYRDETNRVALYDLEVENHPSFSVNGLLVHNSSILKNFDGKRKAEITEFMRFAPYRLLCTATAAPNDWIELGTSSEALGYLGHMDMLTKFFTNKQRSAALMRGRFTRDKWRLKMHAEEAFWRWVASWARAARRPSDLGFDDDRFMLPPLEEIHTLIKAISPADGMLFDISAVTFHEEREVVRRTIGERCEAVAEKVASNGSISMVWCHLNDEGHMLEKLIPNSVQIAGSNSDEAKEEAARWFVKGSEERRVLISKPKIFGFGLNFQHCSHMTYFPTHSYEQYYQATRRLWRFGQEKPVTVHLVYTDGGERMLENLNRKSKQADQMFDDMVRHMNQELRIENVYEKKRVEVPQWMT